MSNHIKTAMLLDDSQLSMLQNRNTDMLSRIQICTGTLIEKTDKGITLVGDELPVRYRN